MENEKFFSELSNEEIENNFNDIDYFLGIMSGLKEALAFEKGSAKESTIARKRSLPDVDVCALRKSLHLTQKEFAYVLGVSSRTVESWEIGRSTPSPTAKKLIFLISKNPAIVFDLI